MTFLGGMQNDGETPSWLVFAFIGCGLREMDTVFSQDKKTNKKDLIGLFFLPFIYASDVLAAVLGGVSNKTDPVHVLYVNNPLLIKRDRKCCAL